jgi:hypothetical protein
MRLKMTGMKITTSKSTPHHNVPHASLGRVLLRVTTGLSNVIAVHHRAVAEPVVARLLGM